MMKKILTLFLALAASVGTLFAQSGTCGDNLTWNLNDGTLTITGTGSMKNYTFSSTTAPWYSSRSSIKTVIIEDGVTSIGGRAFGDCKILTSITIPNSVTDIGEYAFADCRSMNSVTCFATTPPQLDRYVFEEVDKSIPLYAPVGSISAYKSANQWKDFSNILPIGAQPADVTTTTVTPSATTADIAWPQVTGAAAYTIEIKKN